VEYSMNCDVVVIIIVIYHVTVSSNNPAIPFDSTQYNPDKNCHSRWVLIPLRKLFVFTA